MTTIETIRKILFENTGKGVLTKRISALQKAGFTVEFYGEKLNFGTSGTTLMLDENTVLAQLHCAYAVRSKKTGWSYNRCSIYKVYKA